MRFVLAFATMFLFAAGEALADPLNTLYLVIANDGQFNDFSGEPPESEGEDEEEDYYASFIASPATYTVIHFMDFVGGTFPGSIGAVVNGLANAGDFANKQFFFIGLVKDQFGGTHLAIGDARDDFPAPGPIDSAMHEGLVQGLASLGAAFGLLPPGASASVLANTFWEHFANEDLGLTGEDFASIVDDVYVLDFTGEPFNDGYQEIGSLGWKIYSSLDASGSGSENVFGFTDPLQMGVGAVGTNGTTGSWTQATPVPEPGTLLLAGGAALVALLRRRRRS
jgi:hypothetical protein